MVKIKNAKLIHGKLATLSIKDGVFFEITEQKELLEHSEPDLSLEEYKKKSHENSLDNISVDARGALIVPAGVDVHVHSRDPGHTYKEDWQSLAQSAYKGGVAALIDMPNTNPATMSIEDVKEKMKKAKAAGIKARFLAGVSKDNINELPSLFECSDLDLAGVKVYYGQSTGNLMYSDLEKLAECLPKGSDFICVFHSEDQCRIDKRTETYNPTKLNFDTPKSFEIHSQIRDSESAWNSTQTILNWSLKQEANIHLAHVSTPREVEMLHEISLMGKKISSEVSPHHLFFSTDDYPKLGSKIKVNPPVRSLKEVAKLKEYVKEGLIDCFATDHAPHTLEEKKSSYNQCPSGIPSIEFFWPLMWESALKCEVALATFLKSGTSVPAELFGFKGYGQIKKGYHANFVHLIEEDYLLVDQDIEAKCGWSPYVGKKMHVRVGATWISGKCVYSRDGI